MRNAAYYLKAYWILLSICSRFAADIFTPINQPSIANLRTWISHNVLLRLQQRQCSSDCSKHQQNSGEESFNECTVQRQYQKFRPGNTSLEDEPHGITAHRRLTMNSQRCWREPIHAQLFSDLQKSLEAVYLETRVSALHPANRKLAFSVKSRPTLRKSTEQQQKMQARRINNMTE